MWVTACLPGYGGWFSGGSGVFRQISVAEVVLGGGAWPALAVADGIVSLLRSRFGFLSRVFYCFYFLSTVSLCDA